MQSPAAKPAFQTGDTAPAEADAPKTPPRTLLDDEALTASRRLLSRLAPRSDSVKEGSLEALLLELLRPMLAERLNEHLPQVVNRIVAQELARAGTTAGAAPEPNHKPRQA